MWLMKAGEVVDRPACKAAMAAAGCLRRRTAKACDECASNHAEALYAAKCSAEVAGELCAAEGGGAVEAEA